MAAPVAPASNKSERDESGGDRSEGSGSEAASESTPDFTTIARVRRTQGNRGEVFAELLTDFPEKFEERARLFLLAPAGTRREVESRASDAWFHKGGVVLSFKGVDSMSAAEDLIGCEIQIPREERGELEEGAYFVTDLVGCTLFDIGAGELEKSVGEVTGVSRTSGDAPNLVVSANTKEFLVPFVESFVRRVDVAGRRIEMALPEGLLESQ